MQQKIKAGTGGENSPFGKTVSAFAWIIVICYLYLVAAGVEMNPVIRQRPLRNLISKVFLPRLQKKIGMRFYFILDIFTGEI